MGICAFIGDEISATGFRLAGAEVHLSPPEDAATLFQILCDNHALLILTAEAAAAVPEVVLQQVRGRGHPLLLIVGDAAGRHSPPDLALTLRRQLGMG